MHRTVSIESRTRRPLYLPDAELALLELREAVTKTQREAYFRRLRKVRKEIGDLDTAWQTELRMMLNQARREILLQISEARGWQPFYLSELSTEFANTTSLFATRYKNMLNDALKTSEELGAKMIIEPLASAHPEHFRHSWVRVVGLPMDVLESAATMSAELIDGVTGEALANINREVRLISMGLRSQTDAIRNIGRNLTDKSVFGTLATRAETILRTETGRVRSQAALVAQERIKDVQLPAGQVMRKKWLWSGIGRPQHALIDGVMVKVGERFKFTDGYGNKGAAPRMFGVPESDINCGCDIGVVVVDQDQLEKTPLGELEKKGEVPDILKKPKISDEDLKFKMAGKHTSKTAAQAWGEQYGIYHRSEAKGMTLKHMNDANRQMAKIPESILVQMKDVGYTHHFFRNKGVTVLPECSDLIGIKPRGWPKGTTFADCGGVFRPGQRMAIVNWDEWDLGSVNTVLHEAGHMISKSFGTMGPIDELDSWHAIHKANLKRYDKLLTSGENVIEPIFGSKYYRQKGTAGPSEYFAECCAYYFHSPATRARLYPNVREYFDQLIRDLKG